MSGPFQSRGGPLVVVGDVVTDIVVRTVGAWREGTDTNASIAMRPGGSAANTAAWAAASGAREVVFLGRLGGDDLDWHRNALVSAGVDARFVVDPALATTRLIALIDDATGDRSFLTDRGAGRLLSPNDLDEALFAGASWVHLSGYLLHEELPRAAFAQIVAWCAQHEVPWSVDPASAGFLADLGVDRARELLRGAAVGFPNADEALLLAGLRGEGDPVAAASALGDLWGMVVVTLGVDGAAVVADRAVVVRCPAVAVPDVVDAVGAGDAFAGAWLAAQLAGETVEACLAAATATAATALGVVGGRPRA